MSRSSSRWATGCRSIPAPESISAASDILVYGAGAIGQWLAASLARGGARVAVVARPEHTQAMRAFGLKLEGQFYPVQAYDSLQQLEGRRFSHVLLTMKAFDVGGAAAELRASGITVERLATFQNGVGSDEEVRGAWPEVPLLIGTVTRPVAQPAPGQIEPAPRGGVGLSREAQLLAYRLRRGGIKVQLYDDWRGMKWSKLCLNVVGNATGALLDMTPSELFEDRRLFRLEARALTEIRRVVRAHALELVDLPDYPARRFVQAMYWLPSRVSFPFLGPRMARGRGDKPPSLLLELRRGRTRTEIGYLNGAVVKAGAERGIACPINEFLTREVEAVCADPARWELWKRRPDRLLAACSGRGA